MPGLDGVREQYAPVEAMLVEAGLAEGLTSLLAASALIGVVYPMVEGVSGASPGKWIMGIQIARPDGTRGDMGLYLRRFLVKHVRPVFATVGAVSGISALGFLAGPAGLVVTVGTCCCWPRTVRPCTTSLRARRCSFGATWSNELARPSSTCGRPWRQATRCG